MQRTRPAARRAFAAVALASAATAAAPALAQQAGDIVVRAGLTHIGPQVQSGDLSAPSLPGTKIDIGGATGLSGGVAWAITRHWWLDLPLGLPFEHDVLAAGAIAGAGKLGEVKALPITLVLQYRLDPVGGVTPFVGAAAVHARFGDTQSTAALTALTGGSPARPTTLALKNATGPGVQLGLAFPAGPRLGVEISLLKAWLKTTGTLSTGQTIEARLDPIAASFALTWKF